MGFIIIEYGLSVVDTIINIIFLEKLFGSKSKRNIIRYLFMLLYFIASQYLMAYLVPQLLCMVVIEFVFCTVALYGERYEHIIWSVLVNVIYCAISSIVLPLLSVVTGITASELAFAESIERIWMVLIQKFLICMTLWGILSYKGKRLNLTFLEKLVVATMLIANFFIVSGFYVISVNASLKATAMNELFVISLLIVVVLIACAVLIIKLSSKNKQMVEAQMLRFQLESQGDMIENLRKNSEEVRVLRHDLKYHAAIIHDMLINENVDSALSALENYIEQVVQAQQKTDYIKNNPYVNAVIYNCVCKCDERGIACHTEITACYDRSMDLDMAIMYSNLLDNAIRAEENQRKDKRSISLKVYEENGIIKAIFNNYTEEVVIDNNPELKTSKQDKNLHGLGIKSVKNMAKKYNGDVEIYNENHTFSVMTRIPAELKQ